MEADELSVTGNIEAGQVRREWAPDFKWDASNQKTLTRSLMLADTGDTPDLAIRRAGPNGASTDHPAPEALENGTNIGSIYWQGWGTNGDYAPPNHHGKAAHIYARVQQVPSATGRATSLHFQTTARDQIDPRDVLVLRASGDVEIPAGRLRINDGVHVKNTSLADIPTPSRVTRSIRVFNEHGEPLGWVPIYE